MLRDGARIEGYFGFLSTDSTLGYYRATVVAHSAQELGQWSEDTARTGGHVYGYETSAEEIRPCCAQ